MIFGSLRRLKQGAMEQFVGQFGAPVDPIHPLSLKEEPTGPILLIAL